MQDINGLAGPATLREVHRVGNNILFDVGYKARSKR